MPVGARTFLFSCADYMVGRQLVVREVIGGEAFVRGQVPPGEPEPAQPDGNDFLLASYANAFWVEGEIAHFILSKAVFNPP